MGQRRTWRQRKVHMGRRPSDKESLLTDLLCADIAPLHMFTSQKEGHSGREARGHHVRRGDYKTVNECPEAKGITGNPGTITFQS